MNQDLKQNFRASIFSPLGILSIFLLLGFIFLGNSFRSAINDIKVSTNADGITVSGTASKDVTSDKGTLSLTVSASSLNSTKDIAQKSLSDDMENLSKYLVNYGIKAEDINVSPYNGSEECTQHSKDNWNDCVGTSYHKYTQSISFSSNDVNKIKDLSLNINRYLNNDKTLNLANANVTVNYTQYLYTGFDKVKSQMLADATKNAFERAEAIAQSTGDHAGAVITASQGVFQVTAQDDNSDSDYGSYDTSTIDKKITAVVRVSFKVK